MIRVSVLGATGYTGAELLRLLSGHSEVKVVSAASKTFAGKELGEIFSNFRQAEKMKLVNPEELAGQPVDLVFLALPSGQSMKVVPELLAGGMRVIDLSPDFRYRSASLYEDWYGIRHAATKENEDAVFGLPEFYAKEIQNAGLVGNPGCYTTAAILALTPLLKAGLISEKGIIVDGASGITGAGRKADLDHSFAEVWGNFQAYNPVRHRHTSEMEEEISYLSGRKVTLQFTPHLLPLNRGILETIYADLAPDATEKKISECLHDAYKDAVFTHMLNGVLPDLKGVVGSNNCLIGFQIAERTGKVILFSALDNLLKGASGQAVQNMNIMYGLPQDMGLPLIASYL